MRGWRAVLLVVVLAALAGCADAEPEPPAPVPPSETVVTALPPRPTQVVNGFDVACGGVPFDAAKVRPRRPGVRYAGPAPHPVEFVKLGDDEHRNGEDVEPRVPADWGRRPWSEAQLVVCQHPDPTFRGRKVGTCEYLGAGPSDLHSARYVYRVFEAGTGRLVARFTLPGTTGPFDSCPHRPPATRPVYHQLVSSKTLTAHLTPLVTRPVG